MKRLLLTLLTLALASLACSQPIPNAAPVPTETPLGTALVAEISTPNVLETPNAWTTTIVRPVVNVRDRPDGKVEASLRAGASVEILECTEQWCRIKKPAGWVWRGCLSDNPAKLGCQAK